ncbi:MAG: SET domain-containing protein [Acidiferrobacteraceae bacterium]
MAADVVIEIRDSPQHGRGVFAVLPIPAGTVVLEFDGPRLSAHEVVQDSYHLQIGDHEYLGASHQADDYVNHSCDPNCGIGEGLALWALRDIRAGEELTWDYSTAIDEDGFPGFPCRCGTPRCRGIVRSFRDLPASERRRLWPWLMPYLRRKYPDSRGGPGSGSGREPLSS